MEYMSSAILMQNFSQLATSLAVSPHSTGIQATVMLPVVHHVRTHLITAMDVLDTP